MTLMAELLKTRKTLIMRKYSVQIWRITFMHANLHLNLSRHTI